uniref:PHD-type domain-containing protein n=1 Tax=Macrostomum lignano TaxID=282301 RepID=A0A1I8J3K5_9PLAT
MSSASHAVTMGLHVTVGLLLSCSLISSAAGIAGLLDSESEGFEMFQEIDMNLICLVTSPQCSACEQPIPTCQQGGQQPQLHIRCLECGSRFHAECARLLAAVESVADAALDNFYCDACLLSC